MSGVQMSDFPAGLGADLKTLKKLKNRESSKKNLKKRGFSSKNIKKGEQNLKKFLRTLKTSPKGVNWHFLKLYLERCTLDLQKKTCDLFFVCFLLVISNKLEFMLTFLQLYWIETQIIPSKVYLGLKLKLYLARY